MRFVATRSTGEVSAVLHRPEGARALLVLGHGAGAGMRHAFLDAVAAAFGRAGIATFRYQFPYMERGGRRPDPQPVLLKTVRSAVAAAREAAPDLPCFAGGKSMGGRMTSLAFSKGAIEGVRGLVFLGFPLHPAGKPGTTRAEHLAAVDLPMLFLQGTRDRLADLDLLRPVLAALPRATLHVAEGADHGFDVLKRSGLKPDDILAELAAATAAWMEE